MARGGVTVKKECLVLLLIGLLSTGYAQKHFITVLMENYSPASLQLYFTTFDEAASVIVSVSDPQFNQRVFVERMSTSTLTLDSKYMITGNQLSSKAVIVTSDVDISVFAFNVAANTVDSSPVLSIDELGTEYFVFTASPGPSESQFAVASAVGHTTFVNVSVSGSITYNGKFYTSGDTFSVSLEPQQAIQFQGSSDLTGTRVITSAPVAVFSGHKCFKGPSTTCDILFEQLYPVESWGRTFTVFPLANHTGDIIDIMAAETGTIVKANETEYVLLQGGHVQLTLQKSCVVTASKPVMISYSFQDRQGFYRYDPFLLSVPPNPLRREYYKFVTDAFYQNYIMIVSDASSVSEFYLNHKPLDQYMFTTKEMNGFKGLEVWLGKVGGQHEIYHTYSPFLVYVYGLETDVSYGYSLGQETKYEEEKNSPVLNCFPHGAEFHLPLSLVSEANLNVSDIHLEDPMCKGTLEGKFVVINIPINRCGSYILSEGEKTVYSNTVYGTVAESGVHRIEVPLKCEMAANESLEWSFHPQITDVVSQGHYNVSLKLYKTAAFADPITTFPYEVDLHGWLYVEFEVQADEDESLQILVESCKASSSLQDQEKNYNVIQQG
ncbi:uncharacterized protein [Pyxicephalus adspersus]|uniref:uncharacterized protein n=1 Tax=Pyxicephalus adspersus TaxID=30357 RepID=UPI003B5CA920